MGAACPNVKNIPRTILPRRTDPGRGGYPQRSCRYSDPGEGPDLCRRAHHFPRDGSRPCAGTYFGS